LAFLADFDFFFFFRTEGWCGPGSPSSIGRATPDDLRLAIVTIPPFAFDDLHFQTYLTMPAYILTHERYGV
jgi:hypothetical protein